MSRTSPLILLVALVSGLAALAAPVAVEAQNNEVRVLIERVNKLERDLNDIQREVYRSGTASSTASTAAVSPALETLVERQEAMRSDLEARITHLTGLMERLDFELKQVSARLDKLIEDVDYRLIELERGTTPLGTASHSVGARQGGEDITLAPEDASTLAPEAGATDDQTLRIVALPEETGILPEGTPMERYDFAFSFLRQLDFEQAEIAFKEFLAAHPDHELAGNGQYWLGETYYVRHSYADAAAAFLEGYQKAPAGRKAPDNLLKLGLSLVQLGQRDEACGTFSQLLGQFPDAPVKLKDRAASEHGRAGCP